MKFSADSHFLIGKQHESDNKPCQDYALAQINTDCAIAIVSDGCSSGGRTDLGARIVACAAITHAHKNIYADLGSFESAVYKTMWGVAELIELNIEDLLATLVIAVVSKEHTFVHFFGDGACHVKFRNGRAMLDRTSWAHNTPYYIANRGHVARERFLKFHGGEMAQSVNRFVEQKINEHDTLSAAHSDTCGNGMRGITLAYPTDEIESITVFSDGIEQVGDIPPLEVVEMLTGFKNTTGDFAKRRLRQQVATWKKDGKHPMDDISMATIHINHDSEDV